MSSGPQTTNPVATVINKVENNILQGLLPVAESVAIADVPWLGLPVFKQLWEGAAQYFLNLFSKALQTQSTVIVIDTQVAQEQSGLSAALAALIAAEKSSDNAKIQLAIVAYQKAFSTLANSDGSAQPRT